MTQGKVVGGALALAVALIGVGGLAVVALAVTVQAGDLVVSSEGEVAPTTLPRDEPAPISFRIGARVRTADGAPLPAMKTFTFDADRQGQLFTEGLPTCSMKSLQSTTTEQARRICGDALVGTGSTSAVLTFPESNPTLVRAPLLMFNGGSRGARSILVIQVYARTPVATTFVLPGVVTRTSGLYGTRTLVRIPTIANGYGSLKSFRVRIHRTWIYRGKKRSFLIARCSTGRYFAHSEFTFSDGTTVAGTLSKPCTPRLGR
jgi:hypothetical protein